jgi:hypothetical protein
MHPPLAHVLLFLLSLAPGFSHSEEGANLAGFDKESQEFIRSQQGPNSFSVFRWLMPFCSDLSPYLERADSDKRFGGTDKLTAYRACKHFQKQYLPDGWTYGGRQTDWVPNNAQGGTKYYKRVPNTICPIETWPNGNPVGFWAWEHRKGDVKISMLYSTLLKTEMLIVAHKEGGLGVADPTAGELVKIAMQYFQLPPIGLRVPKDWEPLFEIEQRNKRFLSGTLSAKYSGESYQNGVTGLDESQVAAWGRRKKLSTSNGGFFYDGFNLALFVTPIEHGAPSAQAAARPDVNWDLVEKKEKERAQKSALEAGGLR